MDGGKLYHYAYVHNRISATDRKQPAFSWSVISDLPNNCQSACRVCVYTSEQILYWDSGWREQKEQRLVYDGKPLPEGEILKVEVFVRDAYGNESQGESDHFVNGLTDMTSASWITHPEVKKRVPTCFRKDFELDEQPVDACLYVAGIGYYEVMVNGKRIDEARLDPAHTNYKKQV